MSVSYTHLLIKPLDRIILVIPIDKAAPKGRLILPQQQVIRDILDGGGAAVCVRDHELAPVSYTHLLRNICWWTVTM